MNPTADPCALSQLQVAGVSLAVLVLLTGGTLLAAPSPASWHTLLTDTRGKLEHTKALGTATWAVVAFCVLFTTLRGDLHEWLVGAFAALGVSARLASKWLTMRAGAAAPVAPPPAPEAGGG